MAAGIVIKVELRLNGPLRSCNGHFHMESRAAIQSSREM